MSKKIIVFEGYGDHEPGWEFDMPIYMVKPILGYTEDGNMGGADVLVEDYTINLSTGDENEPYEPQCKEELISIMSQFGRAKKGIARECVTYWKRVVEVDDEDPDYYREIERVDLDGNWSRRKDALLCL